MTAQEFREYFSDLTVGRRWRTIEELRDTTMNAYAKYRIEELQKELIKNRETTGFNPETDKIFEKHLKELE